VIARLTLTLAGAIVSALLGVVSPAIAVPATSVVSSTTLPASAPGRLAYSTADYRVDANQTSMSVHGLGTIGLDGNDQRTLTDPQPTAPSAYAGYDHSPQWSPDGNWLAYLQDRAGPVTGTVDSVAVIPRDGGEPQIVDPHGYGPAWSPDGRHLAWVSVADDGGHSIGIADVETTPSSITVTNPRSLQVPDPTQNLGWPTFSPDGKRLAFSIGDDLGNHMVLYSLSTTGEDLRQLSQGVAIESGGTEYASFSPDGTRLLFLAQSDDVPGRVQAFVVDSDGTDQHQVSSQTTDAAAWFPAGGEIALTAGRTGGIRFVDVDGNDLGGIAEGQFSTWGGLTFSPDGTRLYSVASPADAPQWAPDLYSFPVNGDEPQRLTTDHSVFPSTVQAIDPGRVLRQFGDGAIGTAAVAASDNVPTADTLVVSPADDYGASLTAAPLAAQLAAPALLTRPDVLSPQVVKTAARLHASHVVLVGAVSSNIAAALRSAGLTVSRVGQTASPYRVGAAVASQLSSHKAFVVPVVFDQPGGWKLPLAAAGLAAFQRRPLLYARPSSLPTATRRAIREQGITSVTLVGGDNDVSSRLLGQLSHLGVKVHRVRSSDRYAISAQLAQRAVAAGARTEHPIVASGAGWAASAAAPALAALLGQVTVLVDDRTLAHSKPTATWLSQQRSSVDTVKLTGGVRAIEPRVEAQLEHRVR
jgi:Tol biopolymer transport system component/putative cell wall-binding protein